MMGYYSGMDGWGFGLSIVTTVVFWGLIISLAVQLSDWRNHDRRL